MGVCRVLQSRFYLDFTLILGDFGRIWGQSVTNFSCIWVPLPLAPYVLPGLLFGFLQVLLACFLPASCLLLACFLLLSCLLLACFLLSSSSLLACFLPPSCLLLLCCLTSLLLASCLLLACFLLDSCVHHAHFWLASCFFPA